MLTVSVVVSCYNQEQYIEECLDSIVMQSINFDCEIIVSDDCSTDSTPAILKAYSEKYEGRIKLFLRDKNVGPALNYIGVHNLAQGDIVFHFDGDDIMLQGKLQSQYDIFKEHRDVNVVFHKATYFSNDGSYSSNTKFPDATDDKAIAFSLNDLARWGTIAVHSSYAYRRSSRKIRQMDRQFMEWFFAMDSLMPSGYGVYLNEIYVKYRCNLKGTAYLASKSGAIKAYMIYFEDIYSRFAQSSSLRQDLYANFLVSTFAMFRLTRTCSIKNIMFLFKNICHFRPSKFFETIRVRRMVGPEVKIR